MTADNVGESSAKPAAALWVWPFLVGLIATLWLCGVACWVLAVATRPGDGADLRSTWLLLSIMVLIAAGGALLERFAGQLPLPPRLCCHLVAAVTLLLAVVNWLNDPPLGRRADVDGDPSMFWTLLTAACIATASLALAVLAVLRARGCAVSWPGRSRRRMTAVLLCGGLVAGLGVVGGGVLVRGELALTRSVTTTAPDSLPAMVPVLDAKQATGEVAWTHEWPESRGKVELHAGVRGPIAADDNTVVGLDGATGKLLWSHQVEKQWALQDLWRHHGEDRRLLVSQDGTSAAFVICQQDDNPVLVVLDAVTGRQRFALNLPEPTGRSGRCRPQVAMTDHVVVADGIAHDLVTGEELWSVAPEPGFVRGVNGASHLLRASSNRAGDLTQEEQDARLESCHICTLGPHEIVPDRDPTAVVGKVGQAARPEHDQEYAVMMRGWFLEHDHATGANSWLNLDTQQRIPTGTIPQVSHTGWKTDTLAIPAPR